jgi:hypothetical protein
MEMKPVDSSNIAAIGWEADKLCVRFKDGAEYEYPGVTEKQYADLMAAPSKGRALNGLIALRAGVTLKSAKRAEPSAGGPIHTSQAEGCCRKLINNASLSGVLDKLLREGKPFECGKCGTEYHAKAHGPLILWEASCDVLVFKV